MDAEILLMNGADPWGNGWLLPRGPLREPLSAMRRASLIVITDLRASEPLQPILERIQRYHPDAPVLVAEREAFPPVSPDPDQPDYDGRPLLAFCGIANPEGFRRTLAESNLTVVGFTAFPDHHWYSERQLRELADEARRRGASGLITTEKDGVRCEAIARPLPLWVAPIRLRLKGDQKIWHDHLLAPFQLDAPKE
jgi:tetraacyldisaccharide 4'-kinase